MKNDAAPAAGGAGASGASGGTGSTGADDGMGELEEDLPAAGQAGGDKRTTFADTFAKIRAERAAAGAGAEDDDSGAAGAEDDDTGAEPTAEDIAAEEERRAGLTDEERAAEDEAAGVDEDLIVDLGSRREGEAPLRLVAEDKAAADHLRSIVNRAMTRDTVLRIREEAEDIRAEADEMRYAVELDPGGFVLDRITAPEDRQHLARVLLTEPGVLDSLKEWVAALIEHPEALPAQARIEKADRIERRDKVAKTIEGKRFVDANERQLIRTTHKSLASLLPEGWDERRYNAVFADIMGELNYIRTQERVRAIDPRRVPGIIQNRLSLYGVAPAKKGGDGGGKTPPGGKKPAARQLTPEELRKNSATRKRAAGAGPGAGSPASRIAELPARKDGQSVDGRWKQAFSHVRQHIKTLRRAPGR